jgi:hypothetical protein
VIVVATSSEFVSDSIPRRLGVRDLHTGSSLSVTSDSSFRQIHGKIASQQQESLARAYEEHSLAGLSSQNFLREQVLYQSSKTLLLQLILATFLTLRLRLTLMKHQTKLFYYLHQQS